MKIINIEPGTPCDSSHQETINKRLAFILNNINLENNYNILDIGSGYGIYSRHFTEKVDNYICVDIIKNNVKKIKKNNYDLNNLHPLIMSGEFLGFKENTFDAVLMIEVFEHIQNDEKSLTEIIRILKPNGKLIFTVPNKLFPFETHGFKIGKRYFGTYGLGFPFLPLFHEFIRSHITVVRVYSIWHIRQMLLKERFSIKKIEYFGPGLDQFDKFFPKWKFFSNSIKDFLIMPKNRFSKGFSLQ